MQTLSWFFSYITEKFLFWINMLWELNVVVCLNAHYIIIILLKKLEEQTFDIRFFSPVRILGIWVLPGETSTSHNTRFLAKQEHLFHLATPKISSILNRLENLTSKICSSIFFRSILFRSTYRVGEDDKICHHIYSLYLVYY